MIIQKGSANTGGGINNRGSNTYIQDCQIIQNEALSPILATSFGGGVFTKCDMKIDQSTIENNAVYGQGGGLYITECEVIIDNNCKINNNKALLFGSIIGSGSGLFISNARVSIINSQVRYNKIFGSGKGSGIFNSNGILSNVDSIVDNNSPENVFPPQS